MHRYLRAKGIALLAALAGLTFGAWFLWPAPDPVTLPAGQTLAIAQLEPLARLPAFSLERSGAPLTNQDLRGRWAFVFFGYTNCPNACPATLGILNHVQETLRAQGLEPPRIVFVSLDPQRDTPAVLARYAAAFGPDTIGASAPETALENLLTFFGVTYARKAGPDRSDYAIDHTTNYFLVTPDGRWLATFPPAEDPDAVLEDTRTLLRLRIP